MIITLKGADFSASNIGTLSSWRISRSLGSGATYEGATSVDKGAAFTATVTLAEGYEVGTDGVTITMGGIVLSGAHSISGNVITITIASVTGNVLIKVPTINTATGEEEEPEEPDTPVVPDVPTGSVTLTDITWYGAFAGKSNIVACFKKSDGSIMIQGQGSNKRSYGIVDVSAYTGKTLSITYNQNKSADYDYAAFMSDFGLDVSKGLSSSVSKTYVLEHWNNCDDSTFVSVTTPTTITRVIPANTKYLVFSHIQADVSGGFSGSIKVE